MSKANHIEVIARGIMIKDNSILLCRVSGAKWFFLPGGHVEYKEPVEEALVRELKEEADISGVKVGKLAGILENQFTLEDGPHHEINMFFDVDMPEKFDFENQEDHIQYEYISLEELNNIKLLPNTIKDKILCWKNDGKTFWASTNN